MDALMIKPDEDNATPEITLDKANDKFEISGNSLPEDVLSFYTPVIKWIEEYKKEPNPRTQLKVRLNYFNSASSKVMLDLLTMLEELPSKGSEVLVEWHYLEMDEDMLATGQEFQSLIKIPFKFIPFTE
jgi:hypothetical protein